MNKIEIEKKLLKKWKGILTRYTNLKNNNWMRITKRGNITTKKDFSLVKDYYLGEIEKANKIILKLNTK